MKFSIYGRFQLEVRRESGAWEVYRLEEGKRAKMHDIVIPSTLEADEITIYLDDIFHEFAGPGQAVEVLS